MSTSQINATVGGFLWALARTGTTLAMLPFFGAMGVPLLARVLLAIAITVAIYPWLPAAPPADPLGISGMLIVAEQIVIGLSIGLTLQLAFAGVVFAGQLIANSMGLGFASLIDPQNGEQVPLLSQFMVVLTTLLFLAGNAHLLLLELLAQSFHTLPVGSGLPEAAAFGGLVSLGSLLFTGGVMLAMPVMIATLLSTVIFAIVSRTAPQLNLFSIGFPLSMVFGFIALYLELGRILTRSASVFDAATNATAGFLGI